MYGTTAKYNKLQFAYDMMTPEDDWDDDNDLPTEAEAEIEESALIIAADSGESWI